MVSSSASQAVAGAGGSPAAARRGTLGALVAAVAVLAVLVAVLLGQSLSKGSGPAPAAGSAATGTPVAVGFADGRITVGNLHHARDLTHLAFTWSWSVDGQVRASARAAGRSPPPAPRERRGTTKTLMATPTAT